MYEGEPSPHTTTILKSPRGAVEESECREALSLQSIEAFPSLPLNESVALQEDAVIDTLGIIPPSISVVFDNQHTTGQGTTSSEPVLPKNESSGALNPSQSSSLRGNDVAPPAGASYAQMALNARIKSQQEKGEEEQDHELQEGKRDKDDPSRTGSVYGEMLAYQRAQHFNGDEAFDVLLAAAEADCGSKEAYGSLTSRCKVEGDDFSSGAFEMDEDDFPALM